MSKLGPRFAFNLPKANYTIGGEGLYTVQEVQEIINLACTVQREMCADHGKHFKFGWYKYKKDAMISSPAPEAIMPGKYPSPPAAKRPFDMDDMPYSGPK